MLEKIVHIPRFISLGRENHPFDRVHHAMRGEIPLTEWKSGKPICDAMKWVHTKLWANFLENAFAPKSLLRSTQLHHS